MKKILVIQQKMIGDVLTSSILFERLRSEFPEAQLDYLINSNTKPVVENNPYIDNFILLTKEIEQSKLKLLKLARSINKVQYNVVIDVYGKISSLLVTLFSKADLKIGYFKTYSSLIYNHAMRRKTHNSYKSSLAIENRLLLLEPLGIDFKPIEPKIYLTQEDIENAKKYLESQHIDLNQPLIMISVLGSSNEKTYPFEYMAELLDYIVEKIQNVQLLFNYIPKQVNEARAIYNACKQITKQHIYLEVFGNSLNEFLAITYHCDALIGNEGGANNMAKALNKSTFTIFSPYLNKENWFGEVEKHRHVAIHLSDFIAYDESDKKEAKANPTAYYSQLKPSYMIPQLSSFLETLV